MLNKYPLWKYLLLLFIATVGVIYALPNLYPDDPAVQISGETASIQVDALALEKAKQALDKAGIPYKKAERLPKSALLRFAECAAGREITPQNFEGATEIRRQQFFNQTALCIAELAPLSCTHDMTRLMGMI